MISFGQTECKNGSPGLHVLVTFPNVCLIPVYIVGIIRNIFLTLTSYLTSINDLDLITFFLVITFLARQNISFIIQDKLWTVLRNNFTGETRYFECKSTEFLEELKESEIRKLHQEHCVDKVVPTKCLCTMSLGKEECAAHFYARTVEVHTLENCRHQNDIWIDSIIGE